MSEFTQTLDITNATADAPAACFGWSPADEQFFRITGDAFTPAFLAGAGTLLASYDED